MMTKNDEYNTLLSFINTLDKNSYLYNWLNAEKECFKGAMESDFFHSESIKSAIQRKNALNAEIKAQEAQIDDNSKKIKAQKELIVSAQYKIDKINQNIDDSFDRFEMLRNDIKRMKDIVG